MGKLEFNQVIKPKTVKVKEDGTYSDVIFSKASNKKLDDIIYSLGLIKDFKDDYHCTLVYSKKKIPFYKTSKGKSTDKNGDAKSKMSQIVKIKGFGHFDTDEGKNLHIEIDCKFCEMQFNRAMSAGATYDYDNYKSHITLMYNVSKDFNLDDYDTDKYIGQTLEIIEERISKLNLDWVEESLNE